LSIHRTQRAKAPAGICVALIGNPNAGKTTLFNALTGLRAKTANYPGTTVERRVGRTVLGGQVVQLLDLPGLYSLAAATPDERLARDVLLGKVSGQARPTAVVLIVDATNLERNLFLASQVLELGVPTIVALNMIDLAKRGGIRIDVEGLSRELGCPVVPVSARYGEGLEDLRGQMGLAVESVCGAAGRGERRGGAGLEGAVGAPRRVLSLAGGSGDGSAGRHACLGCTGCAIQARYDWAEGVGARCSSGGPHSFSRRTERIDRVLTHPVVGVLAFALVMLCLFTLIFWIAQYPMEWIDGLFVVAGGAVSRVLPEGQLRSLVVEGVIGGVGGMLVFLPQICILFFFLSLLEDTGYLARAAFVMDRLMRRIGLPGKAFVPLLSAHACAIPAIMATRVIEDRRDRLVTILVAPLMTCSARIPVYAMVTALLFPGEPLKAAVLFTGAYALGVVAAVTMAFVFKRTVLPGESRPLVLELPSYKLPSVKTAAITAVDRAGVFVKKAGTIILVISVVLWALSTYPTTGSAPVAVELQRQAEAAEAQGLHEAAQQMRGEAARVENRHALGYSFAGRLGRAIEPALRPLGFDWQIGVGVISSFAAREVIVSTLAVVYGVGADAATDNPASLYDTMRAAKRSDGTAVFTAPTCVSLLVFYVLAMQCLSTQAVTRRETGTWRWPLFQLGYMSVLAYAASFVTYRVMSLYYGA
jgi:ferrous iron transport protein B